MATNTNGQFISKHQTPIDVYRVVCRRGKNSKLPVTYFTSVGASARRQGRVSVAPHLTRYSILLAADQITNN